MTNDAAPPQPPVAPTKPHTWSRPTGAVDDPYAWLATRDDPDTVAYLEAENAFAAQWFAPHADTVDTVFAEIRSRTQETDTGVPSRHGDWWYVTRMEEGKAYPIWCRGRSADTASDTVILDGNVEAEGHDFFDIRAVESSPDHRHLAWNSDIDGSERYRVRVRDLDTGDDLPDELADTSSWGGLAWSARSDTVLYARHDDQMRPFQIWRHLVGSDPRDDVMIVEEADERFFLSVGLTRSEKWIVIHSGSQTSSEALVVPADRPDAEPTLVRGRQPDVEYEVDHWGDRFVVLTNLDAEDFKVVTVPVSDPTGEWTELVAATPGRRITAAEPFAGHLVVHEWDRAQQRLRAFGRDRSVTVVDTGDEPHELSLAANPMYDTTVVRFSYQSLTTPASVYDHDLATGERILRKRLPTPGVDLHAYRSTRYWAPAPDGTEVPVDVVHHVDTPLDATAPLVVYGYGSYEVALPPWFSVPRLSLLDRGVVWALVHPRGGGELGRRWYLDGKLLNKENTFTDTIAAAEHLVAERVADPQRLAVRGGSAGGLLVGACVTKRPDLWAAAVAEVPFVDVVTTMSDPSLPLTVTEWEEWGDPRSEPYASYMLGYSPYDRTTSAPYPAMFVTAGLNDPRVSYHEPAKWVARLRQVNTSDRPIVMRCEMGAGHSGPSGRYEAWKDEARVIAFLLATL